METERKDWECGPGRVLAVLIAAAFVMSAGLTVLSDGSDAADGTGPTGYLVPGFESGFWAMGHVGTETAEISLTADDGNVTIDYDPASVMIDAAEGTYRFPYGLSFTNPDEAVNGSVVKVTVNVTDDVKQYVDHVSEYEVVVPQFAVEAGCREVVRGASGQDIGVSLDTSGALEGTAGTAYNETFALSCGGTEYAVDFENGRMTVPDDLPPGQDKYTLRLYLEGPVRGGGFSERMYESGEFEMKILEVPTFTLGSAYECVKGEEFRLRLPLAEDMSGTWEVSKGSASSLEHTAGTGPEEFVIPDVSETDAGEYTVRFVSSDGVASEEAVFHLKVFVPSPGGFVKLTGLTDDGSGTPVMKVGRDSHRSNVRVEPQTGFRFEVRDSSDVDVSASFGIGSDGYIFTADGVSEGGYTLRFFDDGSDALQETAVRLTIVDPPTVDSIAPSAGFRVG